MEALSSTESRLAKMSPLTTRGLAKLNAPGGMNVAVHHAENDQVAHMQVGLDLCVGADGQPAVGQT